MSWQILKKRMKSLKKIGQCQFKVVTQKCQKRKRSRDKKIEGQRNENADLEKSKAELGSKFGDSLKKVEKERQHVYYLQRKIS